ncbi:MAG: hypothetical protein C0494_17705 [Sphingobium sp.]|nr:hypothetical protein [Sphingobium sp.]
MMPNRLTWYGALLRTGDTVMGFTTREEAVRCGRAFGIVSVIRLTFRSKQHLVGFFHAQPPAQP